MWPVYSQEQSYGFSYLDQVESLELLVFTFTAAEKRLLGTPNRIPISRILNQIRIVEKCDSKR